MCSELNPFTGPILDDIKNVGSQKPMIYKENVLV